MLRTFQTKLSRVCSSWETQLLPGPRVGTQDDLAQVLDGHQGAQLGGGHRGVAEHFLDEADVDIAVEQVCGVGMLRCLRASRPAIMVGFCNGPLLVGGRRVLAYHVAISHASRIQSAWLGIRSMPP